MAFMVVAAPPARYVVDGVSMAPGLASGDVVRSGWFPAADRWRRPRRFERWTIAAADGTAIKRVVGLPGELVEIRDGDLVIDGCTVLKGPRLLADMGVPVVDARSTGNDDRWSAEPQEVLDDSSLDAVRSHVLLPTRDVGVAAIVQVTARPPEGFVRVRAQVAARLVTWRLTAVGRHAVVAGRLDGHLVAAAWHLPDTVMPGSTAPTCLPPAAPERWQVAEPWPTEADAEPSSPHLSVAIDPPSPAVTLDYIGVWRDAHYRPGANGTLTWPLGPAGCFVLGDQPVASTDSRQWGPIPRARLRHRLP